MAPSPSRNRDRGIVTVQALFGAALAVSWLQSPAAVGPLPLGVGAILLATATGIGLTALVNLRRSFRVAPTPRTDAVLITHGIYGRLRHPMYTAVVLVVIALAIVRPGPLVLAAAAANLAFYLTKARYEEGLLLARYPEYSAYRRRTMGVVPGW